MLDTDSIYHRNGGYLRLQWLMESGELSFRDIKENSTPRKTEWSGTENTVGYGCKEGNWPAEAQ